MPALILYVVSIDPVPLGARLLLVSTPAGFPSPAENDLEESIDLGNWLIDHPAASYVMKVEGHSMTGAGINDGDLIVVNWAPKPEAGHTVVALVVGNRTLKRLAKREGRYWLLPEADGYAEILVDENVEIWGIVVVLARLYL